MSKYYTHWCPNGCGKSVEYWGRMVRKNNSFKKPYVCKRCKGQFTKEEMDSINKV